MKGILDGKIQGGKPGENEDEGYQSEKIQVQNMVKYIQEHFGEGLTLATLAGEFKMSESYISSLIKKRTGKGFGEHLMEVRIQKAQEYLRTTNDSIEAIAERVGYPDYFILPRSTKRPRGWPRSLQAPVVGAESVRCVGLPLYFFSGGGFGEFPVSLKKGCF
ncbi:MAG: helix-turn-helix transcriptional regulator [Eisenbergiella massiliensis]